MKIRTKNTLLHVLFWLTMFGVPYLIFDESTPKIEVIDAKPPLQLILFVAPLIITVFYLNAYVFVPRFLIKNKYLPFAFFAGITLFLATYAVNFYVQNFVREFIFLPKAIFPFIIVTISSTAYRLFIDGNEKEKRLQLLENEQLSTELKLLRAQINPHFLFNTLNSLYTLSLKKSDQTPAAIMQLSNMMRYVTTEAHYEQTTLEKELQYVKHFIDLQQLRLPKNMTLDTQFSCENQSMPIAPLLLIPFIENAFKYGVSTVATATITVKISTQGNTLYLYVENQKFQSLNEHKDKSGIGLDNTKQRLELIYPNRHTLTINELEGKYVVELVVELGSL